MNWSAGKIGTIKQRSAQANGLSTPPIGCVLHLLGLPGGGNKIYDQSPYGNIGTITGATWARLPSGLWVLSFDGTDDYITVSHNTTLNVTNFTVKVWARCDGAGGGWQQVIAKGVVNDRRYTIHLDGAYVWSGGYEEAGGANHFVAGNTLTLATWYQLVVTWDVEYVRLYQDGSATGTPLASMAAQASASGDLVIGSDTAHAADFNGMVALPCIYNRALSALEIQNSFNQEKHLFGVW